MDTVAQTRLEGWMQSLLDGPDRLIDLGDHGIPIAGDPVRLVFSLVAGTPFTFSPAASPALEVGRIHVAASGPELAAQVTALRRTARDAVAGGDEVLWLAVGALTWVDQAAVTRVAPLVMWPVELVREGSATRLVAAPTRSPRLNDVLAARLRRDFGDAVEPGLEAGEQLDLQTVLEAATALAAARPGWRVDRVARLGVFSFAKFDLWRDLETHRDELVASAPVRWLAGDLVAPALTPAASDPLVPLDADASQLAAIDAGAAGGSFVLQGPPGTGKTQTIANLAVRCASQGMSVLVVSDRTAALDAIKRRLEAVGLGELCTSAGRTLDRVPRPISGQIGPQVGNTRRTEVAVTLERHVAALHARGGFGQSVHDVVGRLVELRTAPRAPLAEADAPSLDRATFERRRRAVTELSDAGVAVEPVATHPWRSSTLPTWPGDGTVRATRALETAGEAATTLAGAIAALGRLVPGVVTATPDQLRALGALARLAAASPRPGTELLTSLRGGRLDDTGERIALIRARGGGTVEVPRDPVSFIAVAVRHRALQAEVQDRFDDGASALDGRGGVIDASELWTQLKRWTTSMAPLRFVALRTARASVRAAAIPGQLESDDAMLTALEAVIAERACRAALVGAAEPARRWFGELGGHPLTLDLDKLEHAIAWAGELRRAFDQVSITGGESGRQAAWRALVAQVAAAPDAQPQALADRGDLAPFVRLAAAVVAWEPAVAELAAATGVPHAALGAGHDHLGALRTQIDALFRAVGSLGAWTRFHLARRAAVDAGLRSAIVAIELGDLAAAELADAWERATLLAWMRAAVARSPELARFSGADHHVQVSSFADLDRGAIAVARSRMPRLAPCVLATPQQIARHALPAFDLVVFDEASRLPIGYALGALARARAVIVVGDSCQPAPADGAAGLLDVALTAGLPELSLRAHYRSRHHDLFAVPNRRFYGDRIQVLPAAQRTAALGIAWRQVEGAADVVGANRAEAEAVVAEIVARHRDPSPRRSIAVVALSRAQQQLIEDLLDDERALDRTLDAALGGDEPLLVGTPDRMQGDERDLVLVSVGDAASSLGALAQPGAERWLAVAVTRARDQLVLVSSFAPEAIEADAPLAVRGLAELLELARAGGSQHVEAAPASPITAAIARALIERGWNVRHQVGCGPSRVELAVVDPDDPERYVLAIEHDGATYASAASTRDRDRLRAQVLGQLGWRLHRIWSFDWWTDPERETQRAHGAIVAAIAAGRQRRQPAAPTASRRRIAAGSVPIDVARAPADHESGATVRAAGSGPTDAVAASLLGDTTPVRLARGTIAIGPYTAAAIPAGRRLPGDMFSPRHVAELGKVVEQVLAAEAPIHVELLARRVAAYFGVGRITPRITEQVRAALAGRGMFGEEAEVVWRLDQDPAKVPGVRVAGSSAVACRDIAEIPLSELAAAARIVVERATGLSASELVRDCARLIGFARITERITERVGLGVQLAAARELIAIENGRAHLTV